MLYARDMRSPTQLIMTCGQVAPCRAPNAGLLTAGAVFAYSAMLLWGALASEPLDGACVPHSTAGSSSLKARNGQPRLASGC